MLALPMLGRPRRHGGSDLSDKERAAFAESTKQLVATGRVWCVATLRADPYELLLNEPALKALKEAGASLQSRAAGEQRSSPKSSGRRPRPQGTGIRRGYRAWRARRAIARQRQGRRRCRSCNSRCGSSNGIVLGLFPHLSNSAARSVQRPVRSGCRSNFKTNS
jgi:hypothetical protein